MLLTPKALAREIRKGSQAYLLVRLLTGALVLLSLMLLTRVLGASEYGRYGYALSVIALLVTFSQLGMPTQIIRETAAAKDISQWEMARGLWRWSFRGSILLACGLCAVLFLLIQWRGGPAGLGRTSLPVIALLIPPAMVALNNRVAILRGLRFVAVAPVLQNSMSVIVAIIGVGIGVLLFSRLDIRAEYVLGLELFGFVLALVLAQIYLTHRGRARMMKTERLTYNQKYWIAATVPLALIVGLRTINTNVDVIMLGMFRSAADIGVYKIAVRLATFALIGEELVVMVLAPYFARLYAERDTAALQALCKKASRWSFLVAGTIFLAFLFFGRPLLALVFGPEFQGAQPVLLVITFSYLVSVSVGIGSTLLNMTGHEKYTARGVAIATGLNVILNLALIPFFGIIGSALATAISMIVSNVYLWRSVRSLMSIRLGAF